MYSYLLEQAMRPHYNIPTCYQMFFFGNLQNPLWCRVPWVKGLPKKTPFLSFPNPYSELVYRYLYLSSHMAYFYLRVDPSVCEMEFLEIIGSCFLPAFGKLSGQFFYHICKCFFISDIYGFMGVILTVIQLSTF